MKIIKKIISWLKAEDFPDVFGVRYIIKLFRWTITLTFTVVIVVALVSWLWNLNC